MFKYGENSIIILGGCKARGGFRSDALVWNLEDNSVEAVEPIPEPDSFFSHAAGVSEG